MASMTVSQVLIYSSDAVRGLSSGVKAFLAVLKISAISIQLGNDIRLTIVHR